MRRKLITIVVLSFCSASVSVTGCSTSSHIHRDGQNLRTDTPTSSEKTSFENAGQSERPAPGSDSGTSAGLDESNLTEFESVSKPLGDGIELLPGSGNFINLQAARRTDKSAAGSGDVVLNFEKSDLKEVVKTILGEILGASFVIDPNVTGSVSLATAGPISADAVLPALEAVLRMNNAVLTRENGLFFVTPDSARPMRSRKPRLRPEQNGGFQVLVIPLRYVPVGAVQTVLQPLFSAEIILAADAERNHLIVGGTQSELEEILATIEIFDVDQMSGMSFGLFTLQTAEASGIRDELQHVFGIDSTGPLAGMMRLIPIERLNALIVITQQEKYLSYAKTWIEKLDRADAAAGLNMYVYPIQNGRSDHLADLLTSLFANQTNTTRGPATGSGARSPSPLIAAGAGREANSLPTASATLSMQGYGDGMSNVGDVRIISDEENNSLVVMASRADYAKIVSAIRKLDVLPLQVLVEATIVEVSLTDELSYGLQWFFKNGIRGSADKNGVGELFPLTVDPSFSYTVTDSADQTRAVLNFLAADSRLDVLSSPSLMVLDNHTATIRVGDQVPVRTSETTSLATSGSDALITSTIQYRDTGVLLEVTPRVNPGGMVVLEITQDVNDVDQTTTSEIDSPTIIQRRITTNVAVQSGETVVLGGLIRENESRSEAGVPGLRRIPGIGRIFSSSTKNNVRTELLVLITPTAITNTAEARAVSREMKQKMSGIDFSKFRINPTPASSEK